ncbi:UNC93-like protein 1 [Carex rostrata]
MASLTQDKEEEEEEEQQQQKPSPWRYNSPFVQVSLVGLVCFCCPGMFNALSGMGGGGQLDPTAASNANTALYAAFSISGVLGGAAFNLLGPRLTLFIAALTYPLYASSFLYYNHHKSQIFPIVAGGILGVGAGLLWAGQGAIMTSYPGHDRKGSYISLFWTIFNFGGVIGGLIPFALNYHRTTGATSVSDSTYIAFMAFMLLGALLALTVLPPSRVVRNDGTHASRVVYSDVHTEWLQIVKLFSNWKMLLMLPASWASNFFYTYQFNNVNGKLFTLRTKGLNNVFYWGAQMVGSFGIGYLLDFSFTSRRVRGLFGVAIVAALGTAIWGGGLANQLRYTDGEWTDLIDFKDGGRYAGPFVLYFSYGLLDAMFQSLVYWVIGALADDSQILSRYSGFYKSIQSAGAAVAWQVDTHHTPLLTQLIINWVLTTISYPLLALLLIWAVKDDKTPAEAVPVPVPVPVGEIDIEGKIKIGSGKTSV